MYTIKTDRMIVNVPYDELVKYADVRNTTQTVPYTMAVELVAFLNGDPVSPNLLTFDFGGEEMEVKGSHKPFHFQCNDGVFTSPFAKETLARHFDLIESFISEYPDEVIIPVDVPKKIVEDTLWCYFDYFPTDLLPCLSFVQLLTPKSAWSFFETFAWRRMPAASLLKLSEGFTEEEYRDFIDVKNSGGDVYGHAASRIPLVPRSRGVSILSGLNRAHHYVGTDEKEACLLFPPSFVAAVQANLNEITPYVLNQSFDEYAGTFAPGGFYSENMEERVYNALVRRRSVIDRPTAIRTMTMLGLRVPFLGNEDAPRVYMPYRLIPTYAPLAQNVRFLTELFVPDEDEEVVQKRGELRDQLMGLVYAETSSEEEEDEERPDFSGDEDIDLMYIGD